MSETSGAVFANITELSGGTDSAKLILNTYTFATGSQVVSFPEPINFSDGLYFIIGGTADLTVVYNES